VFEFADIIRLRIKMCQLLFFLNHFAKTTPQFACDYDFSSLIVYNELQNFVLLKTEV